MSTARAEEIPVPEHDDAILARMARRIHGSRANPSRKRLERPYLFTAPEDFWDRHLADLVNDSLSLGIARFHGLNDFRSLLRTVFDTTSPLLMGYIQLGGHTNNLALTKWMPTSSRTTPKIQALVQLHARSLVLLEEVFTLTFMGYPSGAAALARTLHEVRVTARFLHRFEARLSERYLASHIIELWQHKEDFRPPGAARRSKRWLETERELDERYHATIAKFGDSMSIENGWAWPRFSKARQDARRPRRIPFSWLEEAVQLPFDRMRYRSGSRQVHAAHLGNLKTLQGFNPNEALLGPRPFGLAGPAVQAAWDAQDVAESLLRSCGRLAETDGDLYYWIEALDQLSHVLRGSVTDAQTSLDYVFGEGDPEAANAPAMPAT